MPILFCCLNFNIHKSFQRLFSQALHYSNWIQRDFLQCVSYTTLSYINNSRSRWRERSLISLERRIKKNIHENRKKIWRKIRTWRDRPQNFSSNLIIFHSFICRRSIEFSQETATRFYFLFFRCWDAFVSPHSSLNSMPWPMVMGSMCCGSHIGWHLQQSFPSPLCFLWHYRHH